MSSNEANPAEKKTAAQELIAANIQALIEQLKAGKKPSSCGLGALQIMVVDSAQPQATAASILRRGSRR
jgi:hypothetical protein